MKIPVANVCRLITPQTHPMGMAGVCLPKVSIVYGLWIQLLLNQSPKCSETVYEALILV